MFKKILCADDLHQRTLKALDVALDLARSHHAALTILNVQPDFMDKDEMVMLRVDVSEFQEKMRQKAVAVQAKIKGDIEDLGGADLPVKVLLQEGKPAKEIIRTARELDADLIILGTHGRFSLKQKLLGSIVEDVIKGAGRSVLAVWTGE